MIRTLFVLALVSAAATPAAGEPLSRRPHIRYLLPTQVPDATCGFYPRGIVEGALKSVFVWLEFSHPREIGAAINIDGRCVLLYLVEKTEHHRVPGEIHRGDEYREHWAASGVELVLTYHVTFECPSQECEGTTYEGDLQIELAAERNTTSLSLAVAGYCGC